MYPVVIEGERLWLREFEAADAPAVQCWTGDVEVVRYVPLSRTSDDGVHAYVGGLVAESMAPDRSVYTLAVVERSQNAVVGAVALTVDSERHRRAEIGYLLRRDRWGQGLATEASRLIVEFGFVELGVHRIWAVCDPENTASIRVLRKLGMTREGLLRDDLLIDGEFRDSELYAVLADQWASSAVYL